MALNAAELTKDGQLNIAGNINTRLPAITDGLVAHFPFDGRGGAFDGIGGNQTFQNIETGVNLIEAMQFDWRDPNSWSSNSGMSWDEGKQALKIVGYHNSRLKTPIIVDPNKHYQVSMEIMEEVQSSTGLYLGGESRNKDGELVTPNRDYSYASNAQPETGVWTKYCCTRYGTGNITNNTSTSFTTTVGWMGTSTNVTDKMTKYYYYGGLFNYSSGGVMYIRNLNVTIVDADTSNTTPLYDGIAVEEATTNLLSGYLNTLTGRTGSLVTLTQNYLFPEYHTNNATRVQIDCSQCTSTTPSAITIVSNTNNLDRTFTTSVKIKNIGTKLVGLSTNLSGVPVEWISPGEFKYIKQTGTGKGPGTSNYMFNIINKVMTDNLDFILYELQSEEKPFATSFANVSRSNGQLVIPITLNAPYTVNFDFTPGVPNDYAGRVNWVLTHSPYNNNLIMWKRVTENYYRIRIGGLDLTFDPTDIEYNKKSNITLSVGTTETLIYLNGNYKGTIPSTVNITAMSLGSNGSEPTSDIFKNLSMYNRQLSADEIKQLANPTFELKPNGDLIVPSIISKPILPDDVYYFPLGADAKDEYKAISPTTEVNTVYENGAVWVGTVTTNLIDPSAYSLMSNDSSAYPIQNEPYEGHRRVRRNPDFVTYPSTALSCYTGTFYDAVAGKTYTHSLKVKPEKDVDLTLSSSPYTFCPANVWTTLTYTISRDETISVRATGLRGKGYSAEFNPWIEYKEFQVEQKPYATPFTSLSRGITNITIDTPIIEVSNPNWTIFGWYKKFDYSTADSYFLNKIGSYVLNLGNWSTNTAFTPYWNGINDAACSSGASIIAPEGEWRFFAMRRNGDIVTSIEGYNQNIYFRNDSSNRGIYFDSHTTTGWNISSSNFNGYVKDIGFIQRTLSNEEINSIYNNRMDYLSNGILQIQNNLETLSN